MMEKIFDLENGVWCRITKVGQICLLSIITLLLTLFLVTAPAAWIALYYAIVKNIRDDRGYALNCYFTAFKDNFFLGFKLFACTAFALLIAYLWYYISQTNAGNATGVLAFIIALVILLSELACLVWIVPFVARFKTGLVKAFFYSFFFMAKNPIETVAMILLWLVALELIFILPILLIAMPGIAMLTHSLITEKIFKKYSDQL